MHNFDRGEKFDLDLEKQKLETVLPQGPFSTVCALERSIVSNCLYQNKFVVSCGIVNVEIYFFLGVLRNKMEN